MRKKPSPDTVALFTSMAEVMGWPSDRWHINMPIICDHCLNEEREAFPVQAADRSGRVWGDLCNVCFDELGCVVP